MSEQTGLYAVDCTITRDNRDFVMTCLSPCYVTGAMVKSGKFYESVLLETIYERYGPGGVYIDFGAFIGTHSVFFSAVCKADLVIAVEPIEHCCAMLMANCLANKCFNVELLPVAAGREAGRVTWCHDPDNAGGNNLFPSNETANTIPVIKASELITVPPKLIKIDTERMSLDTLMGCADVIQEYKPIVVIEDGEGISEAMNDSFGYKSTGVFCATPTTIYEPL